MCTLNVENTVTHEYSSKKKKHGEKKATKLDGSQAAFPLKLNICILNGT